MKNKKVVIKVIIDYNKDTILIRRKPIYDYEVDTIYSKKI